jgi:hypothetical protein
VLQWPADDSGLRHPDAGGGSLELRPDLTFTQDCVDAGAGPR